MTQERKRTYKMWGLYVLFFLLVRVLQDGVLAKTPIADAVLYPLPLAAVCVSIWTGAEKGGLFCLIMGLFAAQERGVYGGILLFSLVLSGLLGGYLCEAVFNRRLLSAVLLCFLSLVLCLGAEFLVRAYLCGAGIGHLRVALRQLFLTLPLSPLMYWICKQIRKAGAKWTE